MSAARPEKFTQSTFNLKKGKTMRTLLPILLICLLAPAAAVLAQNTPSASAAAAETNPISAVTQMIYAALMEFVFQPPETAPQRNSSFKPAGLVRTFGKLLGNIADAQSATCSAVREKNRAANVAKTKAPPELIAGLNRG